MNWVVKAEIHHIICFYLRALHTARLLESTSNSPTTCKGVKLNKLFQICTEK